jgi:hypothetical protein
MAEHKILFRVRKIVEALEAAAKSDENPTLTEQLAQLIALDSSFYEEIVKAGRSFETHTTAALAAVIAVPTTAIMLGLYNNEPDGGRSYIIDRVWGLMIAGTAAAGQASLIGCLGQTRVAAPAAAAGLLLNPLNGNGGKDTRGIAATAALDAVTGVAANWSVLPGQTGGIKVGAAATPGVFINADVNGRRIVPPGREFGMHVLADVVGSTFIGGIEYHEKQITLG